MRLGGARAISLWLCLAGACSDDQVSRATGIFTVNVDIDIDAGAQRPDAARDARVSVSAFACPAVWDECAAKDEPWRLIADAADFGAAATFEALAGDLVLVTAPLRVLQFGPELAPNVPAPVRTFVFPTGAWRALAIARTQGVAVVGCDGERCLLLQAALSASQLREVAGSELPVGYAVRGLRAAESALCVFGSDVSCLVDGRWQSTLALAQDDEVVSLAFGSTRSAALTRAGRVFSAANDGALPVWVEEAPVVGVSEVNIAAGRVLFSGSDRWVERSAGEDRACDVPASISSVFTALGATISILTGAGDLLHARAGGFCRGAETALRDVRAASSGACGSDGDLRVMTATQLIGDNRCDLQ